MPKIGPVTGGINFPLLTTSYGFLVYGLFFVAGWMDILGGYVPSFQFIDIGVAASAWLGGMIGLMISGMAWSPDYVMAPALPALVAGVMTAVLCGVIGMSSPLCRALALVIAILFWNMQTSVSLPLSSM